MSSNPLHVVIVNHYIMRSGITKFVTRLANAMVERGHKVTIYSQKHIPRIFYPLYKMAYKIYTLTLPSYIKPVPPRGCEKLKDMYHLHPSVNIALYKSTDNNLKIQKLRAELRELNPDVCICPLADANQMIWAVTLLGTGIPYICSEHHSPRTIENHFSVRQVRLAAMSGADAIHLLLPSYLESLPDFLKERARAIPNSIKIPPISASPRGDDKKKKRILWLARLDDDLKQWRLAMDAFAILAKKYPDWQMRMAGDGQDSKIANKYLADLNLGERLKLLGDVKDVQSEYNSAHIYCFSSRTEGLPTSLLEAMASGLPSVAFAECEGVKELIKHEQSGIIVEEMTVEALVEGMERLMLDAELRQKLGVNARFAMEDYNEKKIFDNWDDLIKQVALSKGNTVLDTFSKEPLASKARLVSVSRREWLWRDFGKSLFLTNIMFKLQDWKRGRNE